MKVCCSKCGGYEVETHAEKEGETNYKINEFHFFRIAEFTPKEIPQPSIFRRHESKDYSICPDCFLDAMGIRGE